MLTTASWHIEYEIERSSFTNSVQSDSLKLHFDCYVFVSPTNKWLRVVHTIYMCENKANNECMYSPDTQKSNFGDLNWNSNIFLFCCCLIHFTLFWILIKYLPISVWVSCRSQRQPNRFLRSKIRHCRVAVPAYCWWEKIQSLVYLPAVRKSISNS